MTRRRPGNPGVVAVICRRLAAVLPLTAVLLTVTVLGSGQVVPVGFFKGATASSAPAIDTTGLVSHWRMEESAGSVRVDAVDGNDLTDNNNVGRATGKINSYAADFSPASSYLSISDGNTLTNPVFSITCWINPTQNNNYYAIVSRWNPGPNYLLQLEADAKIHFYVFGDAGSGNDAYSVASTASIDVDTWTYVAAWNDGSTLYLQINGGSPDTAVGPPLYCQDVPMAIGAHASVEGFFPGLIDAVEFWNVAIGHTRANLEYNGGSGRTYPY